MSIGELCNREVIVVGRGTDALCAAKLMRQHHVGDLIVVEESKGRRIPVGIVTDRDLVLEVLAQEVDPAGVTVDDIMSLTVKSVLETDDLLDTLRYMADNGIRRLPVVNKHGELEGILTLDDVLELLSEQISDLTKLIGREQKLEQSHRR